MNFRKVIIIFILSVMLYPIALTISQSFMNETELEMIYDKDKNKVNSSILNTLLPIPQKVTADQYGQLLSEAPGYFKLYWNSIKMVVPIAIVNLFISLLACYAIFCRRSGINFKVLIGYAIIMMLPFEVIAVPQFIVISEMGLLNTWWAIFLSCVFNPLTVFILAIFILRVPLSTIEAARLDGASEWTIIIKILMPQMKQGIVLAGILQFVDNWNMVEQPTIYLTTMSKLPLSVALNDIIKEIPNVSFAAAVLYIMPVLFVFIGIIGYVGDHYIDESGL